MYIEQVGWWSYCKMGKDINIFSSKRWNLKAASMKGLDKRENILQIQECDVMVVRRRLHKERKCDL
jgi:hypothetical protein